MCVIKGNKGISDWGGSAGLDLDTFTTISSEPQFAFRKTLQSNYSQMNECANMLQVGIVT